MGTLMSEMPESLSTSACVLGLYVGDIGSQQTVPRQTDSVS